MNKINNTYRIISLSLAFLMFFTSVGFSIDMHYCGNHLKSFSLIGKAKNCYELAGTATPSTCPKHKKTDTVESQTMEKKGCCHNRNLSLDADLTSPNHANNFIVGEQLQDFAIAFVQVFIAERIIESKTPTTSYYKPPLIPKDIPVLVQSFLL